MFITFASGFLGIIFGYQSYKIQRRFNYKERQLNELYSPILASIKEINAKFSAIINVLDILEEENKDKIKEWKRTGSIEGSFEWYKGSVLYNAKIVEEEILPVYRKILDILTTNYSLADDDTIEFYDKLIDYIEFEYRCINTEIPKELYIKLKTQSERLHVFSRFELHVEQKVSLLKRNILNKR